MTAPGPAGTGVVPVGWSRAEADAALEQADATVRDAAASLVALADHRGHALLATWPLGGESAHRWERAGETIAELHDGLERYRAVVGRAHEARGTRTRPSAEELGRVAELLHGESVDLGDEEVPLARRGLVGASSVARRMRPAVLLESMTRAFAEVSAVVTQVAAVWDAVGARLDPPEAELTRLEHDVAEAGLDPEELTEAGRPGPAAWRAELTALRREALSDPLVLDAEHPLDERRVAAAAEGVAALAQRWREVGRLRGGLHARVAALDVELAALTADEDTATDVAATVARAVETRGSALPVPERRAPDLRARRRDAAGAGARGRWVEAERGFAALERDVAAARDRARTDHEVLAGLLARRAELRGRLEALTAKARARGRDTDPALDALRRDAQDRLWSAPCDLAAATVALRRYQRALDGAGEGS